MNITIVGFGNIAHALIGCMSYEKIDKLFVLSESNIHTNTIKADCKNHAGIINDITPLPEKIIPKSDMILFTVPSFARKKLLQKIAAYVQNDTLIGAFPGVGGFNEEVSSIIRNKSLNVFSSQRVPYIARMIEKGAGVQQSGSMFFPLSTALTCTDTRLNCIMCVGVCLAGSYPLCCGLPAHPGH